MKPVKPLFCILLALTVAGIDTALAQTYQWKDSSGRTVISDAPPPKGTSSRNLAAPSAASGELAERELEFRKRRKEAQERAEKADKEAVQLAQRRDVCERARNALAAFESGQPISELDARGQAVALGDAARQQEVERLRGIVADSCK